MIEVKKNLENGLYQIYLNNRLIPDAEVLKIYKSQNRFHLKVPFEGSGKTILKSDLGSADYIDKFSITGILSWLEKSYFESYVDLKFYKKSLDLTDKHLNLQCIFSIQPKSADWDLPFSINAYLDKFISIWEFKYYDISQVETHVEPYDIALNINFSILDLKYPINKDIFKFDSLIKKCHIETLKLLSDFGKDSFVTTFNFPFELKTSCEQYLLYFGNFLLDLGINSISNLNEKAGKVLFSVTPTDDTEALEKIREALAIYLNLPASPIIYDDSFAAMRLKQQVDNLLHAQKMAEMEFRLAQKVIESQDKIIQQKDLTIDQQAKIIEKITDKAVMMNSAENKEEIEEIYEGVKVGESKWLKDLFGLGLNPAKAIKTAVKNTLGKDDKKSILGLDEES